MLEMGLMLPLLVMLTMGATDFGRLFYHAITTANAAGAGATYGAQDGILAGDFDGMERTASSDYKDVAGASATADQVCGCPDNSKAGIRLVPCSDLGVTSCPNSYGAPRAYVKVTVAEKFQTVGAYPGIPSTTMLNNIAYVRVR